MLLAFVCILFFNFVIMWAIQNLIRHFQGRQLRPLVDKLVFKILYRQWFHPKVLDVDVRFGINVLHFSDNYS